MLSDALAALGAYAEPPSEAEIADIEARDGVTDLRLRLANALYGSALAHVATSEQAALEEGIRQLHRNETWRACGATGEGSTIMLHYIALRLASDVGHIKDALPVDLGVMAASSAAATALSLLLETCTIRSTDDPRADSITTNLARAQDQLETAAEHIATLFAASRDVAATIMEANDEA